MCHKCFYKALCRTATAVYHPVVCNNTYVPLHQNDIFKNFTALYKNLLILAWQGESSTRLLPNSNRAACYGNILFNQGTVQN